MKVVSGVVNERITTGKGLQQCKRGEDRQELGWLGGHLEQDQH